MGSDFNNYVKSYVPLEIEKFERLPVDDHLDSNVLKEEPERAKQYRLPSHPSQAVLPAHYEKLTRRREKVKVGCLYPAR